LLGPPPTSPFPYTTLFRSANEALAQQPLDDPVERAGAQADGAARQLGDLLHDRVAVGLAVGERHQDVEHRRRQRQERVRVAAGRDRKSTRLNSSHVAISYA